MKSTAILSPIFRPFSLLHEILIINSVICLIFSRVDEKLSGQNGGYNISQAQAILNEIHQLKQCLTTGEQEKRSLMQVRS